MIAQHEKIFISNLMLDAMEDYLLYIRKINFHKFDATTENTIKQINSVCAYHSQAVLHLIKEDFFWEAELLLRTILEGTVKLGYIACEPLQIDNKIFEFSQILPYINGNKRNKRVENILNLVDLSEKSREADIYKHILDSELPCIDETLNRKNRNIIKRKWDFMSMIQSIQDSDINELVNTTILSYPYGMMSHITHIDFDGLNYIFERFERSDEEREKVNALQMCRQYSDTYNLMLTRSICICLIYQIEYNELLNFPVKHHELLGSIENQRQLHQLS